MIPARTLMPPTLAGGAALVALALVDLFQVFGRSAGCGHHLQGHRGRRGTLLAAGLAVSVCGAGVRPQRESSRTGQSAMKQKPPRREP